MKHEWKSFQVLSVEARMTGKNYITNSIRKKLAAASLLDICAALCGNANGSINHVQHWALKSSVKAANLPFSGDLISFASMPTVKPHSKSINTFEASRGFHLWISNDIGDHRDSHIFDFNHRLGSSLQSARRCLLFTSLFRRHLKLIWQKISANFKLFSKLEWKAFEHLRKCFRTRH